MSQKKLPSPQKVHFIGIGGIGMSGLARILLSQGIKVSGSDLASSAITQQLQQLGATIYQGHSAANIEPGVTVVYSSDIKKENPEYTAALAGQVPLWHRSDLLQQLMQERKSLAIAGTHGKTTTTSLLTCVLVQAQYQPTYVVGGIVSQLQSNAAYGPGEYLVAEADESDGTFLKYFPYGAIVTNIDNDHMNHYGTDERLDRAFAQFLSQVSSKEHLFWCGEDSRLMHLNMPGITYGFHPGCALRATNYVQENWSLFFDVHFRGKDYPAVEVALTGKHNVLNSLAVFGLALQLGIPEGTIRKSLQEFKGVGRRCEKKGETDGILLLDDYAHHPTELRTTLKAIRKAVLNRRLLAVFQPHRYSRMEHCLGTFDAVFDDADELIITDIYASGETPIPGITHELLCAEIEQKGKACRYIPRKVLAETLAASLKTGDVVVSLGAGDITKLGQELLTCYKKHV